MREHRERINLSLEAFRDTGIIDGYSGRIPRGPFTAQRTTPEGKEVLTRETESGLILAIEAYWFPIDSFEPESFAMSEEEKRRDEMEYGE